MIDIVKEKCVGCQACVMKCPKAAIIMKVKDGFKYPEINKEKCINCNLCEKLCPAINDTVIRNIGYPNVYAAWSKNTQIRRLCTSGGVCYELSKYIIESGGYVAGVVWSDNYRNAHYILSNALKDIEKFKQTKYFQPEMDDIYRKVKEVLDKGDTVLYIGSSCTNDALKRYLGREYENLYCLDYICRGYTSQIYHEKRVQYLEKKHNSSISAIQYKNKRMGWTKFGTFFQFINGEEEYINRADDSYELMFKVEDNNTRPSCYKCKYRILPRHTDITVGDFWGIKGMSEKELQDGISVVMISSEKGNKLFSSVESCFVCERRSVDEVASGNGALLNQFKKPNNAHQFFEDLDKLSFEKVEKKYANKSILKRRKIMSIIKILVQCNIVSFIYYNFMCKRVVRNRNKFVFPFYGSRIQLDKGAKLIINDNLVLNSPKHRHSNEQCYLKILGGGCFEVDGMCKLAANNTIEINYDAVLKVGKMNSNYGTTIICGNRIEIGNDVGFGRNVMIYDNNFHATGLNKNVKLKPLIIEDHVWLCTGVTIVKGLKIERDAVCSINSTITRNVKSKNMVAGNPAKVMMTDIEW